MLQLAFYATSMGNWWRSKLVVCRGELCIALENENQWKLAYTGLHNQNFLIIWNCYKIITRNSRRKEFQENLELRKDTIFETVCKNVFNNLPSDVRSEKSQLMFKDKLFKSFYKADARTICSNESLFGNTY